MPSDTIPDLQFEDNTNQRTPCVLVLDGSYSMRGPPIDELNEGLKLLESELRDDPIARTRVQLLVIRAGGDVEVLSEWVDAIDFRAPTVRAEGTTPLGAAMNLALKKIEEQKRRYDKNGIPSTRPWIFLISDGYPTDEDVWPEAAAKCRVAEDKKKAAIFVIGTKDADFNRLGEFSNRSTKTIEELKFRELFVWLSRSVSSQSQEAPGSDIQLSATDDWSTAPT